jgi:hypothetical protein
MANDVIEFLEQAQPADVSTLASQGMPEALDGFHRRRMERIEPSMEAVMEATMNNGQHARAHVFTRANPLFHPPQHADPL